VIDVSWKAKLDSPNVSRDWGRFKRTRKAKEERDRARLELANAILAAGRPVLPVIVTITRHGKRKLDDDNLERSAKHVRDGIADVLGINDGDEGAAVWEYRQEIGLEYRVRVTVEPSGA